jgi:hypothetical protein
MALYLSDLGGHKVLLWHLRATTRVRPYIKSV